MFPSNNGFAALFSTYASAAATLMFFRSIVNEFIPQPVRDYLINLFNRFFKSHYSHYSPDLTDLIFEDGNNMGRNEIFQAAELYLSTKLSPKTAQLKISKRPKDKSLTFQLKEGETVTDTFEGIDMKWRLVGRSKDDPDSRRSFILGFPKEQSDLFLASYINFVLDQSEAIQNSARELKMHTLKNDCESTWWSSVVLKHPSTLETVAMPEAQKRSVVEDLDRFVKRREFYKRVGRAWKRGYLLYGPPGTGKSSLVAAMANYLKFDVYDMQLALVGSDSDLRTLLLNVANKSIIVIEDIDCSVNLPDRIGDDSWDTNHVTSSQLTLSGLLNFIDGLWSSCGDERIIIFTTNYKEKLDPALLRPGRMDMHIHMSYCTFHALKLLASNYLCISDHIHYKEIEQLLDTVEVTPAQVAEEFMHDDVDVALEGLLKLLKEKKMEGDNKE